MLTQQYVQDMLDYDPETGHFYWREMRYGKCVGRAGTVDARGYRKIKMHGKIYAAHILAWVYVHGVVPDKEIDHINNDKLDNRISNLRLATHAENSANRRLRADNKSGHKGVCWYGRLNKWYVQIGPEGNRTRKLFDTLEEAVAFAEQVSQDKFGEFATKSA